jgi:purine-binding chemotaxis protein CheW
VDTSTNTKGLDEQRLAEGEVVGDAAAGLFETVFSIDAQMQCATQAVGEAADSATNTGEESKYLAFGVNFCQLAIPLVNLVEVLQETRITRIPNVPSWLLGVSNLRGEIISVVDVRQLLNMESFQQRRSESIIVVRSNERELVAGLVVDQLSGFRNLHGLPSAGSSTLPQYAKLPYISRVLQTDSQQLAVLDAEKLLGSAEFCRFWL